jgi:IS5 family transposase
MLAKTSALTDGVGKAETVLADAGYFSEANVRACVRAGIAPSSPWAGRGIIRP